MHVAYQAIASVSYTTVGLAEDHPVMAPIVGGITVNRPVLEPPIGLLFIFR